MTLRRDQFERRAEFYRTDADECLMRAQRVGDAHPGERDAWLTNAAISLTAAVALEQAVANWDAQEPYMVARLQEYALQRAEQIDARRKRLEERSHRASPQGDD